MIIHKIESLEHECFKEISIIFPWMAHLANLTTRNKYAIKTQWAQCGSSDKALLTVMVEVPPTGKTTSH